MKRIFSVILMLILLFTSANMVVPVSAAEDNSIYIPKIVSTDNGNKLVYVPELAEIARKMSDDAYGIEKGATTSIAKTMKNEDFVDVKMRIDTSKSLGDLPENFLVGVKNFKVGGKEKHVLAIAFRGTDLKASAMDALIDATTDALFVDLNGFHSGFCGSASTAFNILYNEISFSSIKNSDGSAMSFRDYLECCKDGKEGYYILVTGHSLGGAIANIFTGDILAGFGVKDNAMCYTFGTPTVCSSSKAKSLNAYNIFNIINTKDPVPKVGYNIGEGVRLGKDLKQTVSAGILLDNHKIGSAYKTTTALVRNNIDSMYKYTLSYYDQWCKEKYGNNVEGSNGGGTEKDNNNDGKSEGALGNSIVGVVDIPSSWENLSIRSGPSTNYQIVGSMNDGVRCNVYPSKTKNGWYYVEYNGIYGYAAGNRINTGNSSQTPTPSTPTPTVKPLTPAGISLSTSNVNLNYPNSPTQTITVTATGDLPNTYKFELDMDGYVDFNWGTWTGNSINLTLTAHNSSTSCTPKIYLKDSNTGDVKASISFNVNVTKPVVKEYVTVSFDSKGGSTEYATQTVEQYGTVSIPIKKPSKSGYEFLGWSTDKAALSALYLSGDTVNVGNTDLTLYAVYREEEASWDEWDLSLSENKLYFDASDSEQIVIVKLLEHNGKREGVDYDLKLDRDDELDYDWGDTWYDEDGYRCQELIIYNPKKQLDRKQVTVRLRDENGYIADTKNFSVIYEEKQAVEFADRNPSGISVYLNGEKLSFDVQPQIINSRTMVPMRKIFEELGTVVGWNNNTQKAISVKKGDIVSVSIGGQYLTVNGEQKLLDSPPVIISGRTLVPVRAVAESFNCDVEWYDYGASQVVDIKMNDTINNMENKGGLVIGYCEFAPFTYTDEKGSLVGFDVELANYVCNFWNWDYHFVEIPFDMAFSSIVSGQVDCYWNAVMKTEERTEYAIFTKEYLTIETEYEKLGTYFPSYEKYSVPFQKGDNDTVQLVNIALEEAQKDGTIEYLKYKYGIE